MKIKSSMLGLGAGTGILISSLLYYSFRAAKWFTLGVVLTLLMIVAFMQTENWLTHDATEFENRFWTMVAFIVSFILFFAVDSPLYFLSYYPSLAWLLVGLSTFMAHNYHRHLARIVLSRVPNMKRVTSADFSILEHRIKAKEMLLEIRGLIHAIDRPFLSSTFLNVFSLARVLYVERRIINIFEEADPEQLNFIVLNVQLGLLLYKIKDHRYAHQSNRTKLMTLLAVDRVTELSTASRAMLLDGFQRMKLSAHPQAEQLAQSIIIKTKGDNLSEMKSLTDCKGDFNSMHKLIYWDIRNAKVQTDILKHIEGQAKVQASHMILRTKAARMRDKFAWRKILSDVDDTLTCSGGSFPAGCDVSYPKKCIYPGVLAFYRELDLGITGPDVWDPDKRIGNLVFLSARPHLYKDLLESHSYEKFRRLQETSGMHTSPSLLPGEMLSGTEFFVSGSMEPIARKKYHNFREYLSLYPEFECVFIGDNGQGDVRASEMLMTLENGKFSSNLKRSYIHEVLPLHLTYTANRSTRARSNPNICYFKTYINAALDAYNHGLIRLHGLRAVVEEAKLDFNRLTDEAWASAEGAAAVEAELKAKQLMVAMSKREAIVSTSETLSALGAKQNKDAEEVLSYEDIMSNLPKRKSNGRESFNGILKPGWKRELRLRELNAAIHLVNKTLSSLARTSAAVSAPANRATNTSSAINSALLAPIRPIDIPCRYSIGSVVKTEYGNGIVHWFRPQDGIYEIIVHWGAQLDTLPNFEGCLDRISRARDNRKVEDDIRTRSQSIDSEQGKIPPSLQAEHSTPPKESVKCIPVYGSTKEYCAGRNRNTPECLDGNIVKVYLTAASLMPAPTGAPAYMSLAPRARTSTIWRSVTGLLRSRGDSRKSPRPGRRRSLSGAVMELRSDSRGDLTPSVLSVPDISLAADSVDIFEDKRTESPINDMKDSIIIISNAELASGNGNSLPKAKSSARMDGGMLSLISTMWRGRGGTPTTAAVAPESKDAEYMDEYYDCLVWTPYGTGHVVYIHPADPKSGRPGDHLDAYSEDMVIVELHWGPMCSLRRRNTSIISGAVKGVRVGIGGYPVPLKYKPLVKPTVEIPKIRGAAVLSENSAFASFLKYSPSKANSHTPNRVRASTDGTVNVPEAGVPNLNINSIQLEKHFGSDDPVVKPLRSVSAEDYENDSEILSTQTSLPTMARSRASTIDSAMYPSSATMPTWPPPLISPAVEDAIPEEKRLGYRARMLADWLFNSTSRDDADGTAAAAQLSQSSFAAEADSASSVLEEIEVQHGLQNRSTLCITMEGGVSGGDVSTILRSSLSSNHSDTADTIRKASFNEGFDAPSF